MNSTSIRAFALDRERNELTVTFVTGRTYVYAFVPEAVVEQFRQAPSKGRFFNQHIRERYPHRQVR